MLILHCKQLSFNAWKKGEPLPWPEHHSARAHRYRDYKPKAGLTEKAAPPMTPQQPQHPPPANLLPPSTRPPAAVMRMPPPPQEQAPDWLRNIAHALPIPPPPPQGLGGGGDGALQLYTQQQLTELCTYYYNAGNAAAQAAPPPIEMSAQEQLRQIRAMLQFQMTQPQRQHKGRAVDGSGSTNPTARSSTEAAPAEAAPDTSEEEESSEEEEDEESEEEENEESEEFMGAIHTDGTGGGPRRREKPPGHKKVACLQYKSMHAWMCGPSRMEGSHNLICL